MRFKKKDFEKKGIDEFIDLGGSHIEGHKNYSYDSEVETGPLDKPADDPSTFEKGLSTTTDRFSKYVNPMNWWTMLYSFGGTPYSHGGHLPMIGESEEMTESDMKKRIEELLRNRSSERSIVSRNGDIDLQEPLDSATEAKLRDFATAIQSKPASQRKIIINKLISLVNNA